MKQLYIIEFENTHWCGGVLHCVAWANSEQEAEDAAESHMNNEQWELFSDHYEDEPEYDDGCYYTVNSVELLEGSEYEKYYADPDQRKAFYPCVNEEEAPSK